MSGRSRKGSENIDSHMLTPFAITTPSFAAVRIICSRPIIARFASEICARPPRNAQSAHPLIQNTQAGMLIWGTRRGTHQFLSGRRDPCTPHVRGAADVAVAAGVSKDTVDQRCDGCAFVRAAAVDATQRDRSPPLCSRRDCNRTRGWCQHAAVGGR